MAPRLRKVWVGDGRRVSENMRLYREFGVADYEAEEWHRAIESKDLSDTRRRTLYLMITETTLRCVDAKILPNGVGFETFFNDDRIHSAQKIDLSRSHRSRSFSAKTSRPIRTNIVHCQRDPIDIMERFTAARNQAAFVNFVSGDLDDQCSKFVTGETGEYNIQLYRRTLFYTYLKSMEKRGSPCYVLAQRSFLWFENVPVFRKSEADGYAFEEFPWHMNVISCSDPRLTTSVTSKSFHINLNHKIYDLLSVCKSKGIRHIVLSSVLFAREGCYAAVRKVLTETLLLIVHKKFAGVFDNVFIT